MVVRHVLYWSILRSLSPTRKELALSLPGVLSFNLTQHTSPLFSYGTNGTLYHIALEGQAETMDDSACGAKAGAHDKG